MRLVFAPLLAVGVSFGTSYICAADGFDLPSGAGVDLLDQRLELDTQPAQLRLRFVMPDLKADFDYDSVASDLMALCQGVALPELGKTDAEIRQIVVSVSDRPVEFGEMDAEATQVFETFVVVDGQCTWGDL